MFFLKEQSKTYYCKYNFEFFINDYWIAIVLNKYSFKQYIFLLILIITSIIYTLPNIYKKIPVIQINFIKEKNFNIKFLKKIDKILKKHNIFYVKTFFNKKNINFIFNNVEDQIEAYKIIKNNLNKQNYIISAKLKSSVPKWFSYIKATPIKLGLDLRGGVYFLLKVNSDYVLQKFKEQNISDITTFINKKNINFIKKNSKKNKFNYQIFFKNINIRNKVFYYFTKKNNSFINYKMISNKGIFIYLGNEVLNRLKNSIIDNNINVLRNRVNEIGITDSVVQRKGIDSIIIELPGIQNIKEAKKIIGSTATLEFHLITNYYENINKKNFYRMFWKNKIPVYVEKKIIIDGTHIIDATYNRDEYNNPQVNVFLNKKGGYILSEFSKNHIGDNIASLLISYINSKKKDNSNILSDKKVEIINIATIQSQLGDSFRITGIQNIEEAKKISILLKSGILSSPIKIVQEEIIGPTVGKQNIKQGIKACIIGIIFCITFMLLYYNVFGMIAIFALFINILFIISLFSLLPGLTLTMSGIAGIVLTLAIAIDANVLINERIKEELQENKPIQKAIFYGYKRAFSSIFDSNILTIINSFILYIFGSREIQGFAITTCIGVLTSFFTSVFITHAIINIIYGNKKIKTLPIKF
ncbi:protein translocase subunit SecD [Enterobacteriaceae endosymbiont of Donacia tomentosa]|uniref:protein translocase subunit SecD n=1 Tax=Enterobacteriaceae endosymbiont of Donacia tomentosa TaxID=2675787 RepID=UPI0014492802|nr:protein translocase subunit SecD [Enterobacteriaceae endosymbiont of Donacia tomentosa]QJC31604.1 protein translocase subunit SecD [Enterobacteriaceae endosymbiont of Donacia tomentosa]